MRDMIKLKVNWYYYIINKSNKGDKNYLFKMFKM